MGGQVVCVMECGMIKRRNRFKQTVSLKDRLIAFANDLREEAALLPVGQVREDLLRRASRADAASELDDWISLPALPPK